MRLAWLLLAACGSSAPPPAAPAAPAGQDLTVATSLLCATPTRADADLDYHTDDTAAKQAVLERHMKDRISNARVLAVIDGFKDKPTDDRIAALDQLTRDALLSSTCRLRELWASPPAADPA